MTAPGWTLIEKPSRVYAVDAAGIEICGARQPYGHTEWHVYVTTRVTGRLHQVVAFTRESAVQHVTLIAALFVAAHQPEAVA